MEDPIAKGRSVKAWMLVLTTAAIVMTWLLAQPGWVSRLVQVENEQIAEVFGSERAEQILEMSVATSLYLYRAATKYLKNKPTSRWGSTRGETARRLLAQYTQRVLSMMLVGVMMLPIVLAAAIDGRVGRAIAMASDEMIKNVRYSIGFYLVNASLLMPLLFLVIPLPVNPLFFTIYWLLVAIGVRMIIRHYQYVV